MLTTGDSGARPFPAGDPPIVSQPSAPEELKRPASGVIRSSPQAPPHRERAARGAQHAVRRRRRPAARQHRWERLIAGPWPLLAVLAVQAALTLRLVWSNTAFQDEGEYLWTGQLEWSHLLHGAPLPASLPQYLSGAPVIYPPLGALAGLIGGLAGARVLSLCFMLGATALLHDVTRRTFGRRAALYAVGLFAGTGSVQFVGALATYDAMALFLLALATWAGVVAAQAGPAARTALLVASGVTLAVADAAKYAAVLFDPVVVAVVMLAPWRRRGAGAGIGAATVVVIVAAVLIGAGLWAGGPGYLHGITFTTFARQRGTDPAPEILFSSVKWVGVIAAAAVVGAVSLPFGENRAGRMMAWSMAAAVVLAPAAQARINVITSLFKHVAYGAWFGSAIAGYGLAALASAVPVPKVKAALRTGAAIVVIACLPGAYLASYHFSAWPDSAPLIAALRTRVASADGPMLMDAPSVEEYYLGGSLHWDAVVTNYYFAYADPRTGKYITSPAAAYSAAIQNRYFSLIVLNYSPDPAGFDPQIRSAIDRYGGYALVSDIRFHTSANDGHFLIWVRRAAGAGAR